MIPQDRTPAVKVYNSMAVPSGITPKEMGVGIRIPSFFIVTVKHKKLLMRLAALSFNTAPKKFLGFLSAVPTIGYY
jgi:hypothetical protein